MAALFKYCVNCNEIVKEGDKCPKCKEQNLHQGQIAPSAHLSMLMSNVRKGEIYSVIPTAVKGVPVLRVNPTKDAAVSAHPVACFVCKKYFTQCTCELCRNCLKLQKDCRCIGGPTKNPQVYFS